MTDYTCPCGNPVIVDGPARTGFRYGPCSANLAYHYACAHKLGVPWPKKAPESDPTGRSSSEPGAKLDAGKAPLLRGAIGYFPRALAAVAKVSEHGAEKYTWKGWETVPSGIERYGDALVRHLCAEQRGERFDPDSRCLHAAHAAWNALARLELILRETEGK